MDTWSRLQQWSVERRDIVFDLMRIWLGCGLFAKGIQFASDPGFLPSMLPGGGFDAVAVMGAHYAIGAHLVGGFGLVFGLFTRLSALVQIPALLGAIFFVHLQDGLFTTSQTLEFTLLVAFLLVLIVVHGPGRWSVDAALARIQSAKPGKPTVARPANV